MIRKYGVLLTAGLAIAAAGPAVSAQRWMSINERQQMLENRIDAGVRSGQLTALEANRLRSEYRNIANLEMGYRSGGLTNWERRDLDRRFDRLSASIRDQRHDNQTGWFGGDGWSDRTGVWTPINRRQHELDRRIDMGVRTGRLTRHEATQLRREYRRIANVERRYRRGGLTLSERADLDRRFDRLANRIRWEANDRQLGSNYHR